QAAADSSRGRLAQDLRKGNPEALAQFHARAKARADAPKAAVTEADAGTWVAELTALRAGFLKFNPPGRAAALTAATAVLDRFAVEPAPGGWIGALAPPH